MKDGESDTQKKALAIAKKINGKLPIVYSSSHFEGIAIRFRQQLNENSKLLGWSAVIPEMNHNELVGWRQKAEDKAVIILRSNDDFDRVQTRMEINKKIIKKYTSTILEITTDAKSYWEKAFYLIHLTDWISVQLAELNNTDSTEVKVIDFLKNSLAKV